QREIEWHDTRIINPRSASKPRTDPEFRGSGCGEEVSFQYNSSRWFVTDGLNVQQSFGVRNEESFRSYDLFSYPLHLEQSVAGSLASQILHPIVVFLLLNSDP